MSLASNYCVFTRFKMNKFKVLDFLYLANNNVYINAGYSTDEKD